MKRKNFVLSAAAIVMAAALVFAACGGKDGGGNSKGGSADAKAAAALLKTLGKGDTAAMEKALTALSPAVLAELTGNSGSPGGDFSYDLNQAEDGIIIKKYGGSGGVVVIPSTIEDYPVVRVNSDSFTGGYQWESSRLANMFGNSGSAMLGLTHTGDSVESTGGADMTTVVIPSGVISGTVLSEIAKNCIRSSSLIRWRALLPMHLTVRKNSIIWLFRKR